MFLVHFVVVVTYRHKVLFLANESLKWTPYTVSDVVAVDFKRQFVLSGKLMNKK